MESFGERLKKILKIRRITQKDLAKITGLSQSTISFYIANKKSPSVINAKKIADSLNVDLNWLLSGEEYDDERFKVGRITDNDIFSKFKLCKVFEEGESAEKPNRGMLTQYISSCMYDLDTDALIIIAALMKYLKKCSQK